MGEYDWHPVVPLRWSVTGVLQQQFKRRVCNSRGVWYDEFEWRDVPRQPVDDIPLIKYPAQETSSARPGKAPPDHEYDENGNCKWCPATNRGGDRG